MKILNLSYNNYYPTPIKPQKPHQQTLNKNISFNGYLGQDLFISSFHINPIKHFKKFSIDEYSKLLPMELDFLRKAYAKSVGDDAELYKSYEVIHDVTASCVKSVLDNAFGQNNYVVVPIGRSLSSIGKVLGYKIGENNVKNIPLSDAGRFSFNSTLADETSLGGYMNGFIKFLNSMGLGKNNIMNSGKKYIVTDYCVSGQSLNGVKKLFQYIYGKNSKNLYFCDVTAYFDLIDNELFKQTNKMDLNIIRAKLESNLFCSKYKDFSYVKYCNRLADTKRSVKDLTKEPQSLNLFRFKLLDNEMLNPEAQRVQPKLIGFNEYLFWSRLC